MKKFIFLTLALLTGQNAVAEQDSDLFKYLVLDDNGPSSSVFKADKKVLEYENYLATCLSLAKAEEYEAAEEACSSAIALSKNIVWARRGAAKAYAYNNRGVVRQLASKNVGALDDFKQAMRNMKMDAIRSNLENMADRINNT